MPHYTPENYPPLGSIGHLLSIVAQLKERLLDAQLADQQVTAAQFKVLLLIGHQLASSPAELCRALSVDCGSMTRMLDRLVAKQLLERHQCTEDRRSVRLRLTASGQALYARLPEIGSAALNELLACLDPEELQLFERLLRRIVNASGPHVTLPETHQ